MSGPAAARRLARHAALAAAALGAAFLLDPLAARLPPWLLGGLGSAPGPLRTVAVRWLGLFHLAGFVDPWLLPAAVLALVRGRGPGGARRALRTLLLVAGATVLAGGASEVLKVVVRREKPGEGTGPWTRRPFAVQTWRTSELGFPSGHAAVTAAGAAAVSAVVPPAAPAMLVVAAGCGLQRVAAGAHFPSDVVAGWLLGWAVARGLAARLLGEAPTAPRPPGGGSAA